MIRRAGEHLRLEGEVSFDTVEALLPAGIALFDVPAVVIDLSGVESVDSSAIALLLAWIRAARSAGQELRFTAPVAPLLELARLYDVTEMLRFPA